MKTALMAAFFLAAGTAAAFAQDDTDKRLDQLRREFDKTMKGLQEKFEQQRAQIEKEFRAAKERLLEKQDAPQEKGKEKKDTRGVEDLLREILKRVESLEKRLDGEMPRFREFQKVIPRNFDFESLPKGMPEEFRKWLEQMPKWKGGAEDFKFEFRKGEPKKDEKKDEEKPKEKPKKKGDDND